MAPSNTQGVGVAVGDGVDVGVLVGFGVKVDVVGMVGVLVILVSVFVVAVNVRFSVLGVQAARKEQSEIRQIKRISAFFDCMDNLFKH